MNQPGSHAYPYQAKYDYSQTVKVEGPLVFVSGQGGFDEQGEVVDPDDFELQMRATLKNVDAALRQHGASLETVVKLTVYLARREDFDTFKAVRRELISPPFPAFTTLLAAGFVFDGMLVEADAVAALEPRR